MQRTYKLPPLLLILLAAPLGGCQGDLEGLDDGVELLERAVVNGLPDNGHAAVGALLSGGGAACTATLVGNHTVVTAAHCVLSETKPYKALTPVNFYLGGYPTGGTLYKAASVVTHPSYDGGNKSDLAVIKLSQDVKGITPQIVSKQAPVKGETIVMVGYGLPGEKTGSFGTKRMATNVIYSLDSTTYYIDGAAGLDGNICNGDSGGPSFASRSGKDVFIGVHSTKTNYCGYGATDMRTDAFYSWIYSTAGGDVYSGTPPDQEPPQLAILTPKPGAELEQTFEVKVLANDDIGVTKVVLFLDAKQQGQINGLPYNFTLKDVPLGDHTIEVVAHDESGRSASAAIKVTVKKPASPPPTPKAFGAACTKHTDCQSGICLTSVSGGGFCSKMCSAPADCPASYSCKNQVCQEGSTVNPPPKGEYGASCTSGADCSGGICALNPATSARFCTRNCDPSNDTCPQGAVCTISGDKAVCAPAQVVPGGGGESGGCSLGHGAASPWWPGLLLFLALMGVCRGSRSSFRALWKTNRMSRMSRIWKISWVSAGSRSLTEPGRHRERGTGQVSVIFSSVHSMTRLKIGVRACLFTFNSQLLQ